VRTVKPSIPDSLRSGDYKASVSVRVEVAADGSAVPSLRSSSGNADVDGRVLEALRKWKWKPALKDGEPVASIERFRFDFEVK
jgi:protein TonB